MAPSREIEKLQRRWQENPLGLTFAPLAEAYRKEGMHADALELLNLGLAQHPNYVPAHIVRGRCFLDTRADAAAQQAFLRVADLDPENVIALKGLADIAERAGRYPEAIARLERLLEFDRNNEEARQQLDRLLVATATPSPGQINLPGERDRFELGLVEAARPARPEVIPPPPIPDAPEPMAAAGGERMSLADSVQVPDSVLPADASPIGGAVAGSGPDLAPEPALMPEDVVGSEPAFESVVESVPSVEVGPMAEPIDPEEDADAMPRASIVDLTAEELEVVVYDPVELSAVGGSEFQVAADADDLRPSEARGAADLDLDDAPAEPIALEVAPEVALEVEPAMDQPVVLPESALAEPESAAADSDSDAEPAAAAADSSAEPVAAPEEVGADAAADEEGDDEFSFEDEPVDVAVDDAEAVAGVEAEPELVVTETMAEIFLRQGHRQLALAVYTQLATREPDNPRIREAIGRLEGEFRTPQSGLPTYAAVLTGGHSVRGFFERLLATGRPGPARGPERLSLGAVFGDDRAGAAPTPAVSEAGPSYDEFYADDLPSGDVPAAAVVEADAPPADPDDLEGFTSWLKGLKR